MYTEKLNKVYNCDWYKKAKTLPDKHFNFIFIDPPYFKIKGDFDFKLSFQEWQELHKTLAVESHRLLKDNGCIILWGHALNIAYQQVEFDKYFNLLNSCVWEKINCRQNKNSKEAQRRFSPVTERFLFYDKGEDKSGLTMIYSNPDLFGPIKKYMRQEKQKIKKDYGFTTEKQFNDFINEATDTKSVVSRHYFSDSQYVFPTKEIYQKLQNIKKPDCSKSEYFRKEYEYFRKEYEYFRKEYEYFRKEYEDLRRPFQIGKIKNDVIRWTQEDHITRLRNHPTQKPPGLVKEIVFSCCGKNTTVFEPFTGTETLRNICHDFGFDFIGCELDPDYWKAQEERYREHIAQQSLISTEEIQQLIYTQGEL